jgi:hypothetical protein
MGFWFTLKFNTERFGMAFRLPFTYAFVRPESEHNSSHPRWYWSEPELIDSGVTGALIGALALKNGPVASDMQAVLLNDRSVTGSREDFRLQGRCQAERTNESAPTTGALPNCIQSDLQAASFIGWTSRTCWRSRSEPPGASLPLGSRARGRSVSYLIQIPKAIPGTCSVRLNLERAHFLNCDGER